MMMNRELYEATKDVLGERGARLLAEQIPPRDALATRSDVDGLRTDVDGLRVEVKRFRAEADARFAQLRADIRGDILELKADTRQWMLSYFVPLWIGVYGTLGALVVALILGR